MERKTFSSLLTLFVYFLSLLFSSPLVAQEKAPAFWTRGGNWGNWLKITAYPGLAIRTACGDDSTLKNYLVSSTDWQLRNGYTEPMAVVWRVQFFDDTIGKNKMGGWMLTHLKAGEVLDGWNVEAGHCQARNVISVQVKCAVREADVTKCYDSDGNPYPPRPDAAFSGDHNPNRLGNGPSATSAAARSSGSHDNSVPIANSQWTCAADLTKQFYVKDPIKDTWTLTFRDDGSFENVASSGPYSTGADSWKQQNGQISWYQGALNIGFYGTVSGRTMKLEAKGGGTDQQAESSGEVYGTLTCTGKSIPPLKVRPFYWVCQAQGAATVHTFAVSKVFARPAKRLYESRDFMDSLQSEMGAWLKANDSSNFEQVNVDCVNFETQQEAAGDRSARLGHSKAVDWPAQ